LKYDNWLSDTNIGMIVCEGWERLMVEYYFEFVLRGGGPVDSRYLDREVIPESRREEFMLVRPSVAFLIHQSAGTPISHANPRSPST